MANQGGTGPFPRRRQHEEIRAEVGRTGLAALSIAAPALAAEKKPNSSSSGDDIGQFNISAYNMA